MPEPITATFNIIRDRVTQRPAIDVNDLINFFHRVGPNLSTGTDLAEYFTVLRDRAEREWE